MGKRWKPYRVGIYRLGVLGDQAVATWRDAEGRHRVRLGKASSENEARRFLDTFAHQAARQVATDSGATVGGIWTAYRKDREADGKQIAAFDWNWKALRATFADLAPEYVTAELCRQYAEPPAGGGSKPGMAPRLL